MPLHCTCRSLRGQVLMLLLLLLLVLVCVSAAHRCHRVRGRARHAWKEVCEVRRRWSLVRRPVHMLVCLRHHWHHAPPHGHPSNESWRRLMLWRLVQIVLLLRLLLLLWMLLLVPGLSLGSPGVRRLPRGQLLHAWDRNDTHTHTHTRIK